MDAPGNTENDSGRDMGKKLGRILQEERTEPEAAKPEKAGQLPEGSVLSEEGCGAEKPVPDPEDSAAAGEQRCYTYILRCGDGSLYTGWTNDLEKRLASHQSGRGAKYTKTHQPVSLVYHECFSTKEEAMRREWQIKHLSKAEKEELILSPPDRRSSP